MARARPKARKYMGTADQMQAAELRRNGYTRKSGGTKRSQASDLNRNKKAKSGS